MADLKDMAYTKAEIKEEKIECRRGPEAATYPWGLCIRLEKPELDKLGIKELPKVGDEFHVMAVGRVTGVNQQLRENDDDSRSVAIQLTMMQVADEGDEPDEDGPKEEGAEMGKGTKSVLSYYRSK